MSTKERFNVQSLGYLTPDMHPAKMINTGEVGYIITGIKDPNQVRIGDTLTSQLHPTATPFPGYQLPNQMVFAGIYPKNNDYKDLKEALNKLSLNDNSFSFEEEKSEALGNGFRCGFLGTFHLQIIQERLHEEFDIDVLTTQPNVTYRIHLKDGQNLKVNNPVQFPDFSLIDYVEEPFIKAKILTPSSELNGILKLIDKHKGILMDMGNQSSLLTVVAKMPLSELLRSFFSELKSVSHGLADISSEFLDYEKADLVKVEVDINYSPVDALAFVVHRQDFETITQNLVKKLKYLISRQLYPTPVQAVVEGKAVARVDVPPLRKNAAVNGEKRSISKKQALLRRQSINKRRAVNNQIKIPQKVFNALLTL